MLSTNRLSIHTDIFTQTVQKQIGHMHTYFQSITIHLQDGEYSAIFSGKMLNSMAVEFRAHFQLLPILRLPILASSLLSPKRRPYSSARANQQLCFGSIHPPTILPSIPFSANKACDTHAFSRPAEVPAHSPVCTALLFPLRRTDRRPPQSDASNHQLLLLLFHPPTCMARRGASCNQW